MPVLPTQQIRRAASSALVMSMLAAPVTTVAPPAPNMSWQPTYPTHQLHRPPCAINVGGMGSGLTAPPFAGGRALTVGNAGIRQNILSALPFSGNPLTTFGTDLTVTVDNTTDTLTAAAHGMVMGAGPFLLATTGTFPGNTDGVTPYYASVTGVNTFKLSTSATNAVNGTIVNITSNGTGTITLQRTRSTAPLYSTFVTVFARGDQGSSPNQATDSFGNTYTYVTGLPRSYDNFPNSSASVAIKISGRGGTPHTWSASIGNVGGNEDEVTIGGLEIFHAPILQSSSVVERADGSNATITSGTVTTTARALLVAIIFGNGNVGQDHTFTFLDGFMKVPQVCAEGDLNPSGYIQVEVATRLVDIKGTYSFRAQGTSSEGGQMVLLAFQAATSDLQPFDWLMPQAEIPVRVRRGQSGGLVEPPRVTAPTVTPLSWAPQFPNAMRRSPQQQSTGVTAPPIDPNAGPLTWKPNFPDRTSGRTRAIESGPIAPPTDTNAGPLTWIPNFPDRAPSRPRAIEGGVAAPPTDTNAAPLDWSPIFPDRTPARIRGPTGGEASPPSDTNAGPLSWAPSFPDRTPGRARVTAGTDLSLVAVVVTPVPPLSWAPDFPDSVARLRSTQGGGTVAPLIPIPVPSLAGWANAFPDILLRLRVSAAPGGASGEELPQPNAAAPPLSWSPRYPDAIARQRGAPVVGGPSALEAVIPNPPAPALSWASSFPDSARRARGALVAGGAFAPEMQPVPTTSWIPSFPDTASRARGPQIVGGNAAPEAVLPSIPSPPSWTAVYPDTARRANGAPIVGGLIAPEATLPNPPAPSLSWAPAFPAFAPRALQPVNVGGMTGPEATIPNPPAPPLSWTPGFPDFVPRPTQPINAGGMIGPVAPNLATPRTTPPGRAPAQLVGHVATRFVESRQDENEHLLGTVRRKRDV